MEENLPIATVVNEQSSYTRICRRCNNNFTANPRYKKGTAGYYRCDVCLSSKEIAKDIIYSCSVS